ncbi:unnamed protein product, partial [Amoebophrya sp. A120]
EEFLAILRAVEEQIKNGELGADGLLPTKVKLPGPPDREVEVPASVRNLVDTPTDADMLKDQLSDALQSEAGQESVIQSTIEMGQRYKDAGVKGDMVKWKIGDREVEIFLCAEMVAFVTFRHEKKVKLQAGDDVDPREKHKATDQQVNAAVQDPGKALSFLERNEDKDLKALDDATEEDRKAAEEKRKLTPEERKQKQKEAAERREANEKQKKQVRADRQELQEAIRRGEAKEVKEEHKDENDPTITWEEKIYKTADGKTWSSWKATKKFEDGVEKIVHEGWQTPNAKHEESSQWEKKTEKKADGSTEEKWQMVKKVENGKEKDLASANAGAASSSQNDDANKPPEHSQEEKDANKGRKTGLLEEGPKKSDDVQKKVDSSECALDDEGDDPTFQEAKDARPDIVNEAHGVDQAAQDACGAAEVQQMTGTLENETPEQRKAR